MKKTFSFLLLLCCSSFCFAQTRFDQNFYTDTFKTTPWGTPLPALEYFPPDYFTSTRSFPLLIFAHGKGENGTNLNLMTVNGPLYFVKNAGFKPEIIIIAPQANNGWSIGTQDIDSVLKESQIRYRVDPIHRYITGLSAGGQGAWNYISEHDYNSSFILPAAVLMSMATVPTDSDARVVFNNKTQFWGFGSLSDLWGQQTDSAVVKLNRLQSDYSNFISYAGGHCCWNQFYDPNYTLNGQNIYSWMLSFPKSTLPVKFISFTVNRSIDSTIIKWVTGTELNTDHFLIIGSADGMSWQNIAIILTKAPGGNSTSLLTYSYKL